MGSSTMIQLYVRRFQYRFVYTRTRPHFCVYLHMWQEIVTQLTLFKYNLPIYWLTQPMSEDKSAWRNAIVSPLPRCQLIVGPRVYLTAIIHSTHIRATHSGCCGLWYRTHGVMIKKARFDGIINIFFASKFASKKVVAIWSGIDRIDFRASDTCKVGLQNKAIN